MAGSTFSRPRLTDLIFKFPFTAVTAATQSPAPYSHFFHLKNTSGTTAATTIKISANG